MTYPCLVLDHDDTVVNSTATVHYPCFAEYTAKFFPKAKLYTLEEYVLKNFDPGVYDFFHGEVGMTEDDMKHEQAYWHEYVQHHVPQVYDGMRDILWDYVHAGGTICVVSHSLSPNILRDYRENSLPEPELVYGWEVPKERRKPQPYALFDIMEKLHFTEPHLLRSDFSRPNLSYAVRHTDDKNEQLLRIIRNVGGSAPAKEPNRSRLSCATKVFPQNIITADWDMPSARCGRMPGFRGAPPSW